MNAFPPDLPPSLDDLASIQQHDWQAFQGLKNLENHWQRPDWPPGQRSYHWLLSFDQADEVQRLAKQCQSHLQLPELDPVPLDALHMTLGRIAFTDELAKATALAVANEARGYCRELVPFSLTVGPLAGSKVALRFTVSPWAPLRALHRQIALATYAAVGTVTSMDTSQFRPHLSVAYANAMMPTASLMPTVERLRQLPTVVVEISAVTLVELRREGRAYRYEELAGVRLGGS